MKNHKLAFVDLEMTGLDPFSHEIFEIGIVLVAQTKDEEGKSSLAIISEHNILLTPNHIENADPKSIEIAKYHSRDWSLAVTQKIGLEQAVQLLDGCVLVAQNVSADWTFLVEAGRKNKVDFANTLHYHRLDLASMAFGKLYGEERLFKFSLRELTEYFEVKNMNAHTALSDARATFEVCKKLLSMDAPGSSS